MNTKKNRPCTTDAAGDIVIQEAILGPAAWGSRESHQHPMDATHQQIAACPDASVAGVPHRGRSTLGAHRGNFILLGTERFGE